MRATTIAANYAETLVTLAGREKDLRGWGVLLEGIADAMQGDSKLRAFLETPRVDATRKIAVLTKALTGKAPVKFVRFVASVVRHRRQMLIPGIAIAYMDLVDKAENRMHAHITVARAADDKTRELISERLSKIFAKTVVPHVTVDERILGGIVVRVGDTVMDGSARHKLAVLRRGMLAR
jgi:F-type H+-transporting ATPase subunit delta